MPDDSKWSRSLSGASNVSRRKMLRATGAGIAGLSLSGCLGDDSSDDSGGNTPDGDGNDGGGATPGSGSEASQTLVMLTAETDPDSQEIYEQMGQRWNEETGHSIEFEFSSFENLYSRLGQMIRGGNPPDLMQAATAGLAAVYQDDLLSPLGDTIAEIEDTLGNVPEQLTLQADGEVWSMPYSQKLQTQTIRRDLLEEAGHEFPEDPADRFDRSWEQNLEWVRDIDENTGVRGIHVPTSRTTMGSAMAIQHLWSGGVTPFGGETGNVEVTLDQGKNFDRAVTVLEYLSENQQYAPEGADWSWADLQQAMSSGQIASCNYSVGRVYSVVQDVNPEWASEIMPYEIPRVDSSGSRADGVTAFTSPVGLVTFEDAPNPDLAREYIKFFFSTDLYFEFLLTVPMHLSPPVPELFESEAYQNAEKTRDDILETQRQLLPRASPMNITADGGFNPMAGPTYTEGTLGAMVGRVTIEGMDPEESVQQAADEIRSFE